MSHSSSLNTICVTEMAGGFTTTLTQCDHGVARESMERVVGVRQARSIPQYG